MPLFLTEAEIRPHLRWDELIPAMERAVVDFSAGRVQQPVRKFLTIEEHQGFFGVMPAAGEVMGAKLVTFYPGNAQKGLPTHLALVLLFRPDTGEALAVMDGRLITEMPFSDDTGRVTLLVEDFGDGDFGRIEALRVARKKDVGNAQHAFGIAARHQGCT